jgi:hypothetical protein
MQGVAATMKLLIDIPMDQYSGFLGKCDVLSPEYEMLKNGVITGDGEQHAAVEFLCRIDDAKRLLDLATRIYPETASRIEQCIKLARQPLAVEKG